MSESTVQIVNVILGKLKKLVDVCAQIYSNAPFLNIMVCTSAIKIGGFWYLTLCRRVTLRTLLLTPLLSFGIEFDYIVYHFLLILILLCTICFRQSGPIQSFSHAEVGIRATGEPLAGYVRLSNPSHFMPHISQNSPSRLGQQSQRFNHGRPSNSRGNDWNHMKVQPPPPNINSGGPHSPGNSSFSNGTSWGTL